MRKIYTLLLGIVTIGISQAQVTTLFSEDFDGPPSMLLTVIGGTPPIKQWHDTTNV
ncbi:MAG: hypothetical protein U5L96_05630 [Owenweeksia sp.]|nr:hypothetical protein [Owenweeksia sp.]